MRLLILLSFLWAGALWALQSPSGDAASPQQSPQDNQSSQDNQSRTNSDGQSASPPPSGTSSSENANSAPASDSAGKKRVSKMAPPRSDRVQVDDLSPATGQSSSKETQEDLSAPTDDVKAHPQSSSAVAEAEAAALTPGGISEMHSWDPHKAAKSVEVGDFYFKRKNYRAAEDRYREALRYKDNDAVATMRLAICLEKLGIFDDARAEYESYLKILPHGAQAPEAQKAIERLKAETETRQAR